MMWMVLVRLDQQIERLRGLFSGDVPETGGQRRAISVSGASDPLDLAEDERLVLLRIEGVVDGEFDGVCGRGHWFLLDLNNSAAA